MRRTRKPNAVVASAAYIKVDSIQARQYQKARRPLQLEAWQRYDDVGEVKRSLNWFAHNLSKMRLVPALMSDPTRSPVVLEEDNNAQAWDAIERLKHPYGSHSRIIFEAMVNWLTAGEGFLHAREGVQGDDWDIKSIFEVSPESTGRWNIHDDEISDMPRLYDPDKEFLVRLWLPHPRRSIIADSPLMGVLEPAEELLLLSRAVRGIARSRMTSGILTVPDELSFGADDATEDESADKDPFNKELIKAMTTPIQDESHASGHVPMVVRGPAEFLKELRYIKFERPFDKEIDKRTERAIRRLAQGLPLPVEILLGFQSLSHWTAFAVTDAAWTQYMEPYADAFVDALTVGYFWPALGIGPDNPPGRDTPILWYDASRVVSRPDRSNDYKDAHERYAISDDAYRRGMGFPSDDAPSDEEIVRRMLTRRGVFDPVSTESGITQYIEQFLVDRPGNQTGAQPKETPKAQENGDPRLPSETAPNRPSRQNTVPLDSEVRTAALEARLMGAADSAVRRAMERAGARLRTMAQKKKTDVHIIAAAPNFKVAALLGPQEVEHLGMTDDQLIEGSFSDFKDQFRAWAAKESVATEVVRGAWGNLYGRLATLAKHSLYSAPDDLDPLLEPVIDETMRDLQLRVGAPANT